MALLRTVASSRIFTRRASKNTTGYIRSSGRLCHTVTSATMPSVTVLIRSGETSTPYISARKPWISRTVIQRENLVVEAGESPLVFADQPRLEGAVAIAGHLDPQRPVIGQHGLAAAPIAVIRGFVGFLAARRVPEMVCQLAPERALDDGLLEAADGRVELLRRDPSLTDELIQNL